MLTATWIGLFALTAAAQTPVPREPLPPIDIVVPSGQRPHQRPFSLTVKFVDAAKIRANAEGMPTVTGSPSPVLEASLAELLQAHSLTLVPRLDLSEARLQALEGRASLRSGRAQPDLAGMHRVRLPHPLSSDALAALAHTLQAHPLVEYAFISDPQPPPPGDVSPATPDYRELQTYLEPDPGIDVAYARSLGVDGSRLAVSDCEYGWEEKHEDLIDRDLHLEADQTVPSWVSDYGYDTHGTAVVGITSGVDNGYGITGTMPGAEVFTYPEYSDESGERRASAIAAALADSSAGDVVMLEMQIGVVCTSCYGPAELDPDIWTLVRTGVDAGVVVVAAAGNGGQDLDDGWYADNYATWGDSGAILVGAGSADTRHDAMYYSTHGNRLDVQGWGERVFTLGYGDYASHGGDPNQRYTSSFAGTSSATPIVASAVMAVQDYVLMVQGTPLEPESLRALLSDTGIAQGSGDRIGPLPDVRAALAALDGDFDGHLHPDWDGEDCDDSDASIHPGAEDTWYDDIDSDCAGNDDHDRDGDGYAAFASGGDDCDDDNPDINPIDTPTVTCVDDTPGASDDRGKASACTTGAGPAWLGLLSVPLLLLRRRAR